MRAWFERRIGAPAGSMTRHMIASYFDLGIGPYERGPFTWDDSGRWQLGTGRGVLRGRCRWLAVEGRDA